MGRSVDYVSDAVHVWFFDVSELGPYDFEWFIESLQYTIQNRYPSFSLCDSWDGKEQHRILDGVMGRIVLCEYCGCASISLATIADDHYTLERQRPIMEKWCASIVPNLTKLLRENFPCMLNKLGTFSNGESVYEYVTTSDFLKELL